ncbi:hypothetical protein D1AOALGA4SA_4538 [Olavius algarvensis Delta 1 endosymbiont]|nr:hypothetical protein D1AOALGA4SA_4538 [Olavius algarvensis Delta 1 endosymbiont]
MQKNIKWLLAEIDIWLNEGLIGSDQAESLIRRYRESEQGPAWGRIIFFSIGAILFGLGVILLFAYNWERMHKFAKLAVIAMALLTAHGMGFWLRQSGGRYQAAGEGLHLTGTMFFGAGIWLTAQIYHINEHYPTAFLVWGMGALAMAWSLPSISHAILATALVVLWNGFEAIDFKNPRQLSPFIILAGLMPLAWIYRARVLLAATIAAFLMMVAFSVATIGGDLAFLIIFQSSCVMLAAGTIVRDKGDFPGSAPLFSFYGNLIYLATLFALSFFHRGQGLFTIEFDDFRAALYFFSFSTAAIGSMAWSVYLNFNLKKHTSALFRMDHYAAFATLLLVVLNALGVLSLKGWAGAAVFNAIYLFHSIILIVTGCKELSVKATTVGCLLLAAIAMARYTDLFASLVARSAVFLMMGAALFAVGFYYSHTKKQLQDSSS